MQCDLTSNSGYHKHTPSNGFFSLFNLSLCGCLFPWFFMLSDREDFSLLNEERRLTRMGWNEGGIFDCFIRWGIKLRSLQAKWNIQNILYSLRKVFRLFIYLIVWKRGSSGQITKKYKFKEMKDITPKTEKVSS